MNDPAVIITRVIEGHMPFVNYARRIGARWVAAARLAEGAEK